MKHIGSAITTAARTITTETGTQRGERGLAMPDVTQVAAWLSKQAPADMDKAAVSRASSHGVALRVRYESRYPSGPNGERLPSYDVAIGCEASGGNIEAALSDLRNFLTPAPIRGPTTNSPRNFASQPMRRGCLAIPPTWCVRCS